MGDERSCYASSLAALFLTLGSIFGHFQLPPSAPIVSAEPKEPYVARNSCHVDVNGKRHEGGYRRYGWVMVWQKISIYSNFMLRRGFEPRSWAREARMIGRTTPAEHALPLTENMWGAPRIYSFNRTNLPSPLAPPSTGSFLVRWRCPAQIPFLAQVLSSPRKESVTPAP
jgi:hypothetical protein